MDTPSLPFLHNFNGLLFVVPFQPAKFEVRKLASIYSQPPPKTSIAVTSGTGIPVPDVTAIEVLGGGCEQMERDNGMEHPILGKLAAV